MYTLFLIGIACCIVLGAAFVLGAVGIITYCPTLLLCCPIFRALDKTFESGLAKIICKLILVVGVILAVVATTTELTPLVPLGIIGGFLLGFHKASKVYNK